MAGEEITNTVYRISVAIANPVINGIKNNPMHNILNCGADLIGVAALCFSFVAVDSAGQTLYHLKAPQN